MRSTTPVKYLAYVAEQRYLPSFFEQAWKERTGVNPVSQAIEAVQASEIKSMLVHRFQISVMLLLSGLVGSITYFRLVTLAINELQVFEVVIQSIFYFYVIATGLSMSMVASRTIRAIREARYPKDQAEAFYADLMELPAWSGDFCVTSRYFSRWTEETAKESARRILINEAKMQLTRQKLAEHIKRTFEEVNSLDQEVEKAFDRMSGVKIKYDTLQRLGLVPFGGGYGKYFAVAEKEIAEAEDWLPTS